MHALARLLAQAFEALQALEQLATLAVRNTVICTFLLSRSRRGRARRGRSRIFRLHDLQQRSMLPQK